MYLSIYFFFHFHNGLRCNALRKTVVVFFLLLNFLHFCPPPFLAFRGAWCVVRGVWFRICSRSLVCVTPPTVLDLGPRL